MNRIPSIVSSLLLAGALLSDRPPAQCGGSGVSLSANWNVPMVGIFEPSDCYRRALLIENTEPFPVELCNAAMVLSHDLGLLFGQVEVSYELWSVVALGGMNVPGVPVSTATASGVIQTYQSSVRCSWLSRPVLQPGQRRFLVATYSVPLITSGGTWIRSPLSHGPTDVESMYWKNGQWNYSLPNGYTYHFVARPFVAATSQSFGAACGAPAPCSNTPSESVNWSGPMANWIGSWSKRYAFRMVDNFGHPAREICGLDLPLAVTGTSAVTLPVFVYDEAGTAPGQLIGQTTVVVQPGSTATPHHVTFATPVPIGAGQNYWIAVQTQSFSLHMPVRQFGSVIAHRESSNGGANWSNTIQSRSWSVRVYETTGPATLLDLNSQKPILGQSSLVTIDNAAPNGLVVHAVGFTNPSAPLAAIGAPGCWLLSSAELPYAGIGDGAGTFTMSLPIPGSLAGLGFEFYGQGVALMPGVNALGLAFSNGRKSRVGSY